jgi:hypothetical protein
MKMFKKYSDLIILTIIWIVSIYSVISVIVNSYVIGVQNFIGYGLLIGISILRFLKIKKIKTILGIFLIVGSINAIQFTDSKITFIFTWTPFGQRYSTFGIQPFSILLLIFFILINFSDFMRLLTDMFSEDPKILIEKQKRIAVRYYDELKNEKDSKLHDIVENKNTYQIEYVRIAQRLIEERENNKNAP